MKNASLIREWIRSVLSADRIDENKSLAGLGEKDPQSPFAGKANGQMSFLAEWAVYFAVTKPGDSLDDQEWALCQTDQTAKPAFEAVREIISKGGPEGQAAEKNFQRVREILGTMKSLATSEFQRLEKLGIDIDHLGKESQPKPGTDEVDVVLKSTDIHVKLNDDKRIGGLQRGKVEKGVYLAGYASSDIYYQAVEQLVKKYVTDEKTADEKYRSRLVGVPDDKWFDSLSSGAKKRANNSNVRDFVSTDRSTAGAGSNILIGTTKLKLKTDKGKPILDKKGIPEFEEPVFTPSQNVEKLFYKGSAEDETLMLGDKYVEGFAELWIESRLSGPFIAVPDPSDKNPNRTGYGVKFVPSESPDDGVMFYDNDYLEVTKKGAQEILKDFEAKGKEDYTLEYEHYARTRVGTMGKSIGGVDRASGDSSIVNPLYKEANAAYNDLFVDKHDEFIETLKSMDYDLQLIPDIVKRVFGVEQGDFSEKPNRPQVYFKFKANWPKANKIQLVVTAYPGIPKMVAKPQPVANGKRPSSHWKIYGTGALENAELFQLTFRHFDGSHPPQINLGKDADVLTSKVLELPAKSQGVKFSDIVKPVEQEREVTGKAESDHPAVSHFMKLKNGAVRDKIMKDFMNDSNIVVQRGVELAPVSRGEILSWVESNWNKSLKSASNLPKGPDGVQNDNEGKTWVWVMIARGLQDIGAPLTERAHATLNILIKEEVIKKWAKWILLTETDKS